MESAQQHDSKQASPAPVSFKPALLGAGLLFSVFLNAIRFFSEHGTGATPSLHPFAVYAGWGLTGAGIVLAALAMLAKRADRRTPDLTRTAPLVTGACLVAIGVQFMLPLYTQLTLPFAEPAMFGLAFGAGLAMLATAWGSVFARLEPENLLFNSAWGIVAAAVVHFAAEPLSPSPIGLALIACSLVTSVALLFVARTFNDETAAPHPAGAESASEDDHRIRLRKAAAILWMPLVGACITCFIFGLTWDPVISSEQMRLPDPLGAWKSLIGPSLLAIVVALFVLRKANSSPLRLLNQTVYPIAVALLLALPVISSDSDVAAGIIDVLTQASFAVIALAIWCSMASAVRSVPFAATFVFPACAASPSSAPTAARSVSSCSPCTWRSSPYRSRKARGSAKAGAPSLTARTTRARTSTAAATRWQPNGGCRRASARCCTTWDEATITAMWPRSSTSPRTPCAPTCATSTRSSPSTRARSYSP